MSNREIPAISEWTTNADLITDANRLHPLGDLVLDVTYGRGRWWTRWRPTELITNDINPEIDTDYSRDFRDLEPLAHAYGGFEGVAYDPPYKLNGTPALAGFDEAYGIEVPTRWQDRVELILEGLDECLRVVRPGGFVYAKCQDQVVSGQMVWQTLLLSNRAYNHQHGARLVDRFDMLGGTRPQPEGRSQKHARGRGSTLLIFERIRE